MYNGIINIYKEAGFTSHDVVAKMRGIVKQKKIGHTGTLDPDAVGVLPVCLGTATKLCDMLTDKSKEYEACMLLGTSTDTQDISGKILETREVNVSAAEVKEAIMSFVGEYDQIPPMYSALKVDGKKLYELARAGKTIERQARRVEISNIEIISMNLPEVTFKVGCSKGTYIRTLCYDIGEKLGCLACMKSLKRTRVGNFLIEDAVTLKQVEELVKNDSLVTKIMATDEAFMEYDRVQIKTEFAKALANGNKIALDQIMETKNFDVDQKLRVYDENNKFTAVYTFDGNELKPFKMFFDL